MLGLVARLLGGAISPIVDQVSGVAGRLARKIVLLAAAALCVLVVVAALTLAFFLWIAALASPVIGALSVAGLYLAFAAVMTSIALRGGSRVTADAEEAPKADTARDAKRNAEVDRFAAPLMALLAQFGLKRELLAVMAGTSVAKQLGPVPLVALAIVGGFLIGRLWKGWRAIPDIVSGLASSGLFGFGLDDKTDEEDETPAMDKAA